MKDKTGNNKINKSKLPIYIKIIDELGELAKL